MTRNYWTEQSAALTAAFTRQSGPIRFELVTRALRENLPKGRLRIVDIGGGTGTQAILLARMGHAVTVVDSDATMLAMARLAVAEEPSAIRARIALVEGDGAYAARLVGANFDLACCHSVLMYLADPTPMVRALVGLVRPGGLISVMSVNKDAIAMRSGLQRRWREAAQSLVLRRQAGDRYAPSREVARDELAGLLEAAGAKARAWYGVGVFTDHLDGPVAPRDLVDACVLEWLAGCRDPYRQVARCFHYIAERVGPAASGRSRSRKVSGSAAGGTFR